MKRIIVLLLSTAMLVCLCMNCNAGPAGVVENPELSLPFATPSIDGNITDGEGWSGTANMNYETLGFFWAQQPLTFNGAVRFAWDNDNFYYCADIEDGFEAVHEITGETIEAGTNQFIYSSGFDDVDQRDNGGSFGYNGDVFGMLIDPLGLFVEYGYTGNEDNTPWYLVGLFEGDTAKMYREESNPGDITDQVKVAGRKTENGWCFEAAIPWDLIIKDVEDLVFGDFTVDKELLLSDGAKIRTAGMYVDRFFDAEAEEVATWGLFVTVPTTLPDGTPGHLGTGTNAMSLGINLKVASANTPDSTTTLPDTTADEDQNGGQPNSTEVVVTDEKGSAVTSKNGHKVTMVGTTTKRPATGASTASGSAQTFDMGIAIALGALVASGIGICKGKKR